MDFAIIGQIKIHLGDTSSPDVVEFVPLQGLLVLHVDLEGGRGEEGGA